jgi:hypothetical protein
MSTTFRIDGTEHLTSHFTLVHTDCIFFREGGGGVRQKQFGVMVMFCVQRTLRDSGIVFRRQLVRNLLGNSYRDSGYLVVLSIFSKQIVDGMFNLLIIASLQMHEFSDLVIVSFISCSDPDSHECGSLSPRYGVSSGCGWRNGLLYGG